MLKKAYKNLTQYDHELILQIKSTFVVKMIISISTLILKKKKKNIYKFLEHHILKALWRFTILKINKKLQKTIKSLSKKKGLEAPFECV